ncbi:MAG: hypothetical protein IT457_20290 [Planctomycetes bacterium]|nr:hypothetical protein [Planctomycetota bacterium]
MLAILAACVFQSIEPIPSVVERGEVVRIVVKDAAGQALPALEISLDAGGPTARRLGLSDARGELEFVPEELGELVLRVRGHTPELAAPLLVVAPRPRLALRIVGIAAALALLVGLARFRPPGRARPAA